MIDSAIKCTQNQTKFDIDKTKTKRSGKRLAAAQSLMLQLRLNSHIRYKFLQENYFCGWVRINVKTKKPLEHNDANNNTFFFILRFIYFFLLLFILVMLMWNFVWVYVPCVYVCDQHDMSNTQISLTQFNKLTTHTHTHKRAKTHRYTHIYTTQAEKTYDAAISVCSHISSV